MNGTPTYSLYKNGVAQHYIVTQISSVIVSFASSVDLLAGEYFDVRPNSTQNTTGGTLGTYQNTISIVRVGN